MSGAAANTTNDVSSEVPLFRTVVFAVTHTATILADLVFVIAEGTVESREFAKLIAFMIILAFWGRRSLENIISNELDNRNIRQAYRFNNPVDHLDASRYFLLAFTKNETMKIFFGIVRVLIRSSLSLFDTPFPSDANLCTTFSLHLFQAVATGTNE
jgi:hypothetical protein